MLAAAILAAGESRRMGRPKALLPYRGTTFLEHLIDVVRHPGIGILRIVLGAGADEILSHTQIDHGAVIINPEWEKGQLSSIRAALKSLRPRSTEGLLICPVDQPLISAALVATLIERFDSSGKGVVLPTYKGKRGHPVIFRSSLYEELVAAPDDVGARAVVWAHAQDMLEVPTEEEGCILNLNDPSTLEKALGRGL